MVSLKEQLHKIVDELPEGELALEEMQQRLLVLQQINKGLAELDREQVVSHDQVRDQMRKWLSK